MPNLRHFAATTLTLAALCAATAAHAQDFPASPLPSGPAPVPAPPSPFAPLPSSAVPLGPAPYAPLPPGGASSALLPAGSPELPPPDPGRYEPRRKSWYGWQILIPSLASDAMIVGGVLGATGSRTGLGIAVSGLVGHGISGPIVHLAHGKPLKALASLGLEAALPALILATTFAFPCSDFCSGNFVALVVGVPIALTAGTAIDSSALAWEIPAPRQGDTARASVHLAPLVLPPLRAGSTQAPAPSGLALAGTF